MNFLAALERDINVCAILSRLYHRNRKLQEIPYFESHIMELVQLCDQDDNADIVCIAVAFMMEAVAEGEVGIGELAQIVACEDILRALLALVPEEDEDQYAHLMRITENERARIVKTHDTNLRLKKVDQLKDEELFTELFRVKSILESFHVQNFPQESPQGQPIN